LDLLAIFEIVIRLLLEAVRFQQMVGHRRVLVLPIAFVTVYQAPHCRGEQVPLKEIELKEVLMKHILLKKVRLKEIRLKEA